MNKLFLYPLNNKSNPFLFQHLSERLFPFIMNYSTKITKNPVSLTFIRIKRCVSLIGYNFPLEAHAYQPSMPKM